VKKLNTLNYNANIEKTIKDTLNYLVFFSYKKNKDKEYQMIINCFSEIKKLIINLSKDNQALSHFLRNYLNSTEINYLEFNKIYQEEKINKNINSIAIDFFEKTCKLIKKLEDKKVINIIEKIYSENPYIEFNTLFDYIIKNPVNSEIDKISLKVHKIVA